MDKDKSLDKKKVWKPEEVWAQVYSDHDPDKEAVLCSVYTAQAEPDSDTLGNFMRKEGAGHARGAYLLEGNHLKNRVSIRTLSVRTALSGSVSKQFEPPEGC